VSEIASRSISGEFGQKFYIGGIRTQNCNLELSHAHIRDEESWRAISLQDPANSLLGLINSLFGAN
jgi:hypothetical protein